MVSLILFLCFLAFNMVAVCRLGFEMRIGVSADFDAVGRQVLVDVESDNRKVEHRLME